MKKIQFLLMILFISIFSSCDKDTNIDIAEKIIFAELQFYENGKIDIRKTIVEYDDILAYDSAQHVFQLKAEKWQSIRDEIGPTKTYGFGVLCDNELVYNTATHLSYSSYISLDHIYFSPFSENYIKLYFFNNNFSEVVNDKRLIELLANDKKLKVIDLQIQ